MIEQRLESMDKKFDGVVSSIHEVLREIKATSDRMQRMEIEATELRGHVDLLEQRLQDYFTRSQTTTTTTTSSQPSPSIEDELARYRKRISDIFLISVCMLGIFGVIIYFANNVLNKQAAEVAVKALEHTP